MENWILTLAASPLVYVGMYLFAVIDGFFPPIPSESLAIALAALSVASGRPNGERTVAWATDRSMQN